MLDWISQPWPWYVAGPLIGLTVPILLLVGNKAFGISSSLRHVCAATVPRKLSYFAYDWRTSGLWNLTFVLGVFLGGLLSALLLTNPEPVAISEATKMDLISLGITDFSGMMPSTLFSWSSVFSFTGFIVLILGGFLIGFGTRYAGGCTSGHAITGLASFQLPSLIATTGFFAGGLITTYFLLPLLF